MQFPVIFALVVGLGMLAQWGVSAMRGQIPELKTEPIRIAFHLAAEFTTAIALLAGGLGLLLNTNWAADLYLVGAGMLMYTAIVSPGYFVHQGKKGWIIVFGILLVLDVLSILKVVSN
jgi:hypothetical protein